VLVDDVIEAYQRWAHVWKAADLPLQQILSLNSLTPLRTFLALCV
jgi:hypothetical protein